jgi:NAD(P)-dependent dehydrogenase (short-subunit alcohol dehydrogenase family)
MLKPRTILVVGAGRGIGARLVAQLVARGDAVIATCRRPSDVLAGLGATVIDGIDVADATAGERISSALGDRAIDDVVIVAGILERVGLIELGSAAGQASIRRQFEVNALGPLLVAAALAPRLHEGSRLALLTSRMGSIADNTSGGHYGYRMSKAALNMAGMSLARDLQDKGVAVALLHPGYVRTDMTGGHGQLSADESAALLIARLDGLHVGNSGTYWHANGEVLPW